jgi:hypothetical protein
MPISHVMRVFQKNSFFWLPRSAPRYSSRCGCFMQELYWSSPRPWCCATHQSASPSMPPVPNPRQSINRASDPLCLRAVRRLHGVACGCISLDRRHSHFYRRHDPRRRLTGHCLRDLWKTENRGHGDRVPLVWRGHRAAIPVPGARNSRSERSADYAALPSRPVGGRWASRPPDGAGNSGRTVSSLIQF